MSHPTESAGSSAASGSAAKTGPTTRIALRSSAPFDLQKLQDDAHPRARRVRRQLDGVLDAEVRHV